MFCDAHVSLATVFFKHKTDTTYNRGFQTRNDSDSLDETERATKPPVTFLLVRASSCSSLGVQQPCPAFPLAPRAHLNSLLGSVSPAQGCKQLDGCACVNE